MTVVSLEEFNNNQEKYFDIAMNEYVYIQRGDCMFVLVSANEDENETDEDEKEEDTQPSFASYEMERVREEFYNHLFNS